MTARSPSSRGRPRATPGPAFIPTASSDSFDGTLVEKRCQEDLSDRLRLDIVFRPRSDTVRNNHPDTLSHPSHLGSV